MLWGPGQPCSIMHPDGRIFPMNTTTEVEAVRQKLTTLRTTMQQHESFSNLHLSESAPVARPVTMHLSSGAEAPIEAIDGTTPHAFLDDILREAPESTGNGSTRTLSQSATHQPPPATHKPFPSPDFPSPNGLVAQYSAYSRIERQLIDAGYLLYHGYIYLATPFPFYKPVYSPGGLVVDGTTAMNLLHAISLAVLNTFGKPLALSLHSFDDCQMRVDVSLPSRRLSFVLSENQLPAVFSKFTYSRSSNLLLLLSVSPFPVEINEIIVDHLQPKQNCRIGEALKPGPKCQLCGCEEETKHDDEFGDLCVYCHKTISSSEAPDPMLTKDVLFEQNRVLITTIRKLEAYKPSGDAIRNAQNEQDLINAKCAFQDNIKFMRILANRKVQSMTKAGLLSALSRREDLPPQKSSSSSTSSSRSSSSSASSSSSSASSSSAEEKEKIRVPTATGDQRAPIRREPFRVDDAGTVVNLVVPVVLEIERRSRHIIIPGTILELAKLQDHIIKNTDQVLAEAMRPRIPTGYSPPWQLLYDADAEFPRNAVTFYSGAVIQLLHQPQAALQQSSGVSKAMTIVSNGLLGASSAVDAMHEVQRRAQLTTPVVTDANTTTTCGLLSNVLRQHTAGLVSVALGEAEATTADRAPTWLQRLLPGLSHAASQASGLTRNIVGPNRYQQIGRDVVTAQTVPINNMLYVACSGVPSAPNILIPEDFHQAPPGSSSQMSTMGTSLSSDTAPQSDTPPVSTVDQTKAASLSAQCQPAQPSTSLDQVSSTKSQACEQEYYARDPMTATCRLLPLTGAKRLFKSLGSFLNSTPQTMRSPPPPYTSGSSASTPKIATTSKEHSIGSASTSTPTTSAAPTPLASNAKLSSGAPLDTQPIVSPSSQETSLPSHHSIKQRMGRGFTRILNTFTTNPLRTCSTNAAPQLERLPTSFLTMKEDSDQHVTSRLTCPKTTSAKTPRRSLLPSMCSSDSDYHPSRYESCAFSSKTSDTCPDEALKLSSMPASPLALQTPLSQTLLPILPCSLRDAEKPDSTAVSSQSWSVVTTCSPGPQSLPTLSSFNPTEVEDLSPKSSLVTPCTIADSAATLFTPAPLIAAPSEPSTTTLPQPLNVGSKCSAPSQACPNEIGKPTSKECASDSETKSNMSQSLAISSTTSSRDAIEPPASPCSQSP